MSGMSVAVDLAALADRVAEFGDRAYLVTVGDDGPHVVSVQVSLSDGHLGLRVGRGTAANLTARPAATVLWPPGPGGEYSLIVDGEAVAPVELGPVRVRPTTAVLHRVAGTGDGPACLPVDGT